MTLPITPTPFAGAAVDAAGGSVIEFDDTLHDANRRLPAVIALAKHTGGVYAEQLAGMSIDQALVAAGLDFHAVKVGPVTVPYGGTQVGGLERSMGVVAEWPTGSDRDPLLLGVVGTNYPVMQPAATGEFGQMLLDEGGGTVAAVCAYGVPRGSQMVLALKLPGELLIGGQDRHDLYLYVGNSFNTQTSLWGCVAPIRIDCTNQAAATFGKLACRFGIRHTGDIKSKVDEARLTLRITGTFAERFRQAAEVMLATPMPPAEVSEFVKTLIPTPRSVKTAGGADRWDVRRGEVCQLITDGARNTVGRGTRYAAYQGVVEHLDHQMPARSAATRYARLVNGGEIERVKIRAAALLLQSA